MSAFLLASEVPAISKALDWAFAPSGLLAWSDGFDGVRYSVRTDLTDPRLFHLTAIQYNPDAEGQEDLVLDVVESRHDSIKGAQQAAQAHQDAALARWMRPEILNALRAAPVRGRVTEARAVEIQIPASSATWTVEDMAQRQKRALRSVFDAGEAFLDRHTAPERSAPSWQRYSQAWGDYQAHEGPNAITHERLASLTSLLLLAVPRSYVDGADSSYDELHAVYCEARDLYLDQRDRLRHELQLPAEAPELMTFLTVADRAASAPQGRIAVGHSAQGFHAIAFAPEPGAGVEWSEPVETYNAAVDAAHEWLAAGELRPELARHLTSSWSNS
ncbi:MAG: hypothetical protein EPN79_16080 [Burkholderiaceae bacterium]|nr:MAG: hypothetical protein EPN79_16080 [Burkholderiaceae bacterium]